MANLGKEMEDGEVDSEEQRLLDIEGQFMADFKEQLEAENIRELEQEQLPKGLEEITPLGENAVRLPEISWRNSHHEVEGDQEVR